MEADTTKVVVNIMVMLVPVEAVVNIMEAVVVAVVNIMVVIVKDGILSLLPPQKQTNIKRKQSFHPKREEFFFEIF